MLTTHPPIQNTCTAHLLEQLQRISAQQGKIRDLRNKLGAFREVAAKQGDAFAQLGFTKQLRAAYMQCLAECVRRCGAVCCSMWSHACCALMRCARYGVCGCAWLMMATSAS